MGTKNDISEAHLFVWIKLQPPLPAQVFSLWTEQAVDEEKWQ